MRDKRVGYRCNHVRLVVFVLIQLWRVTKAGKKTEKVCRIITGQVNKHLSVVRKETLSFYKADFLQSC